MTQVIICVGLPGSGKSTYAKNLPGNNIICEADGYFTDPISGEYRYNSAEIGKAHEFCMRTFLDAVWHSNKIRYDNVIASNTNTQLWEITPYTSVSAALGIRFKVIKFVVDPEVCIQRNVHNVPPETVYKMSERLNKLSLPKHWNVLEVKG